MKNRKLTFKFTMMFVAFTLVTLVISSILSYLNQMHLYNRQREESIQYIADYLEKLVKLDGNRFPVFQKHFLAHFKEYQLPVDFDEHDVEKNRILFETLFAEQNPGKILGKDISFDELSKEAQDAYAIYNYEYYRIQFEEAAKSFNIAYAYYLVPTGEPEHMYWFLDIARDPIEEGSPYLYLCYDVHDPVEKHPCMWEAWETGKQPAGYDIYDASFQYGNTYAYYNPLIINGEKLGVIGVEVEIGNIHKAIFHASIRQMLMIGSVLVLFMFFLLYLIRSRYIRKLTTFHDAIEAYSKSKDNKIARALLNEVTNRDEISTIISKFVEMIYELSVYMENLTKTRQDLQDTQKRAQEMGELATRDALTGIRNKTACDKEIRKLEWEIANGETEVGIAMIDLNFLKRINDTYGHDKGNIAIISLCKLVCQIFSHSPVFRIGGDEFVVILKEHDLYHIDELITLFKEHIAEIQKNADLEYWEKTSAAIGYARYDTNIDATFANTFKRADNEMYKDKKLMKATRE